MADAKQVSGHSNDHKLKIEYFRVWKAAFGEIVHWPENRVVNWAKRFSQMDDPDSLFYHQSALWYVVPWLTPRSISERRKGLRLFEFHGEVERAILGDEPGGEMVLDFHWAAARKRLADLLMRNGESLENVERELDDERIGL